jgi:hypothetical protein
MMFVAVISCIVTDKPDYGEPLQAPGIKCQNFILDMVDSCSRDRANIR